MQIARCREIGVEEIEILLTQVSGKWRLDKLLAHQIQDLSRSQIEKGTENGAILLDGQIVKPGIKLREKQRIYLRIDVLN